MTILTNNSKDEEARRIRVRLDNVSDVVLVYDEQAGEVREVARQEAAAGLMRFARSLGPGTPACGVWERKALALLRGQDWQS